MVLYSHWDKSAVCASPGFYVGKKDSEVKVVDGNGYVYSGGTQIGGASGRLYQGGSVLTYSHARTGYGYFKTSPTVAAGSYLIAAGSSACSRSATINTGLTTVHHAVCGIMGKCQNGKIATLDLMATPDTVLDRVGHAYGIQWRIKTGALWVKLYGNTKATSRLATMDPMLKRHRVSWIAVGV